MPRIMFVYNMLNYKENNSMVAWIIIRICMDYTAQHECFLLQVICKGGRSGVVTLDEKRRLMEGK